MYLSTLDAREYSRTPPRLSRGRKMTGKLKMSREHHPTCCRPSRLSKEPCLSLYASCLEYVRVNSTRFFILLAFFPLHSQSALIPQAWLTPFSRAVFVHCDKQATTRSSPHDEPTRYMAQVSRCQDARGWEYRKRCVLSGHTSHELQI